MFPDQPSIDFDLMKFDKYKNWLLSIGTIAAKNIIKCLDNVFNTRLKI